MGKKPTKREAGATAQALLLERLQGLKEADLQNSILTPLFQALGYGSVDPYGGPDEHGIDLVCWKRDEIDEIELAVVQIKRFKPGRKTYSSTGFAYLTTQLSQACERKVPHSNGHAYLPRTVYFVTPHPVDARTLSARFEKFAILKQVGVKIIDGPKLTYLLRKELPELIQQLLGHTTDIKNVVADRLNNDILLDALNCPSRHRIEDLYMDVDFSLGSRGARLFLLGDLSPRELDAHLRDTEWRNFLRLSSLTERVLGTRLSIEPHATIQRRYRKALSTYQQVRSKLQLIQEKIVPLEADMCALSDKLSARTCKIGKCRHQGVCKDIVPIISTLVSVLTSPQHVRQFLKSKDFLETRKRTRERLSKLPDDEYFPKFTVKNELERIESLARKILPLALEQLPLKVYKRPLYHVRIPGTKLGRAIQKERRWIIVKLELCRSNDLGQSELTAFLQRAHTLLDCGRQMFREWYTRDALQVPRSAQCISDTGPYRLEMSVHNIFDCGLNTLVLGDAGAGKTTTLQMYAKTETQDSGKLRIYIDLPSLMSCCPRESQSADRKLEDKLIGHVAQYLSSVGCHVPREDLARLFNSGDVVLELDGMDEVIAGAPWLLDAIISFSQTYDATQIILSSRISRDFADDVPFISVTLLPFSGIQRDAFIKNWLGKESPTQAGNAKRIISHLKKNSQMGEIVRNPLLTTVLCALQEHGVPLPESEVRLHGSRIELLLGLYDVHKGAKRLKCHHQDLQDVAERVAFVLHGKRIRHAHVSEITQIAKDYPRNKSTKTRYARAVQELIHPCEILVPMTSDGRVGFGHMRYQEYLAARYLSVHRDEDVVPLGNDPWWREVFVLLTKMLSDSEWLVSALAEAALRPCLDTIKAIISAHPPRERPRLIRILRWFEDMEDMDILWGEASQPISYLHSDPEIPVEDLLSQKGAVRGRIHNMPRR